MKADLSLPASAAGFQVAAPGRLKRIDLTEASAEAQSLSVATIPER